MRYYTNYLCHYGIKEQRWGIRRYQYKNGRRTSEGKKRYPDRPAYMNNTLNKRLDTKTVIDKSKVGERFVNDTDTQKSIKFVKNSIASSGFTWITSLFKDNRDKHKRGTKYGTE